MQWNEALMSTGVPEVDAQHQELIKRLNELFERMQRGDGVQAINPVLDFLANYATRHFSHEEDCMNRMHCPAAVANKQAHAAFLTTFTTLRRRFDQEGPSALLAIETQKQLTSWLTSHICKVDTQMKSCVKNAAAR
jgi:hemerythrin